MFGLRGSLPGFALSSAYDALFGTSDEDLSRLKAYEEAKGFLKQQGLTDKDIGSLSTEDIFGAAQAYGYKGQRGVPVGTVTPGISAAEKALADQRAAIDAGKGPHNLEKQVPPGVTVGGSGETDGAGVASLVKGPRSFEDSYAEASRIAGQIAPLTKAEVPSAAMAVQSEKDFLKAAGFDTDLYKNQIEEIRKDAEKDKGRKSEAMNLRLLEAGLGILGGESPYAFVNIGKGSLPAAKGLAEDIKDLRKLEKDRQKSMRDLAVAQNQVAAGIGAKASERVENAQKRLERQDEQQAALKADIAKSLFSSDTSRYVAELSADTQRAATKELMSYRTEMLSQEQKKEALSLTDAYIAKLLASPAGLKLASDPVALENLRTKLYTENLAIMQGKKASAAPASQPRGKLEGNKYVLPGK